MRRWFESVQAASPVDYDWFWDNSRWKHERLEAVVNKCSNYSRSVGKQWSIFPLRGKRNETCHDLPHVLQNLWCFHVIKPRHNLVNPGLMTPLCYVMMEIMRSPHFRTSKRSFEAVWSLQERPKMPFMIHHFGPSNSGHFFLEPQRKMLQRFNIFWEILDIHQIFVGFSPMQCPKWESWPPGLARSHSPRLFPSPWPTCVCRIPPLHRWKSWIFFQLENSSKPGSKCVPTSIHAICFPRKSCSSVLYRWRRMSFAQRVGWNNASFRFWDANPEFSHSSDGGSIPKGSNCQMESPLDFHSHSAAFSFTTLNLCSLRVLERNRVKFRVQNATAGGDGDGDDD